MSFINDDTGPDKSARRAVSDPAVHTLESPAADHGHTHKFCLNHYVFDEAFKHGDGVKF
jgi:hypothetical protein